MSEVGGTVVLECKHIVKVVIQHGKIQIFVAVEIGSDRGNRLSANAQLIEWREVSLAIILQQQQPGEKRDSDCQIHVAIAVQIAPRNGFRRALKF